MHLDQAIAAERPQDQDGGATAFLRLGLIALMAFLTVVDLFAAQALLPTLAAHYGVSPAAMGLAVNACTLGMAVGGLGVAFLGHRIPRRGGILVSLSLLSVPTLLLAVAPDLTIFSLLRVAQGLAMSAAFGLTLAYLGERYMAESAASAFAAYITGNVASNLIGRLIATAVTDHASLSAAFAVFAALNLSGAALVYFTIDRVRRGGSMTVVTAHGVHAIDHLFNPVLRAGFAIGFCILFAFIGTFTYINFELVKPPLGLGMMELGIIYFVFLPSIVSTPLAGRAVSLFGVRPSLWGGLGVAALGLPLLLQPRLGPVLTGMVLVAVGTFFAQAVATGFVSRAATHNRSAASGIYLACYFLGGLAGSAVLGRLYQDLGWAACVAGIGVALVVAALLCTKLRTSAL
ncbi:MAG: MFS transporter [Hyphomicrobium sp.]|jgi:predicted MFS family arabinose efflux permease